MAMAADLDWCGAGGAAHHARLMIRVWLLLYIERYIYVRREVEHVESRPSHHIISRTADLLIVKIQHHFNLFFYYRHVVPMYRVFRQVIRQSLEATTTHTGVEQVFRATPSRHISNSIPMLNLRLHFASRGGSQEAPSTCSSRHRYYDRHRRRRSGTGNSRKHRNHEC